MKAKGIMKVFRDTAYVRMGGSEAEAQAAQYLADACTAMGLQARIEKFDVDMATIEQAELTVDGVKIPCKGYLNAGSAQVDASLYYLRGKDAYSLSQCKGKIVLIDGYLGYILENGAVGFITYDGNANYADRDIDQRELRSYVHKGNKLPGVNINAKDAIALIRKGGQTASITLRQLEYTGSSQNVILDMPGETEQYVAFTAHYDSTSLSKGAYDNMSGSVGLLAIAEHFTKYPHRFGVRLIWCGSEERGLLGSKAYCTDAQALKGCVLNVNLDMIGCTMGKFIACVTAEEKLCHYISYLGLEKGFGISVSQDVYSSDSTPFADKGIPAVSFARIAPNNTATIHNSYDTAAVMSGEQMVRDIEFIIAFAERTVNAVHCPVAQKIPANMQEKLDEYLCRKRPADK